MLTHLNIQNFAIVSELELELNSGLTVVTGETGAGKSIMVDALSLVLGGRSDASIVRHGSDRAEVQASFDLSTLPEAQKWLAVRELDCDCECLLRRTITKDGRSRAYINGSPLPLQEIRQLGQLLINIHSQHQHQSLMRKETHRELLDHFADLTELSGKTRKHFHNWHKQQQKLLSMQTNNEEQQAKLDLLQYQVKELNALGLEENELAALESEHKKLANADNIIQACQLSKESLRNDNGQSAADVVSHAQQQLKDLGRIDDKLDNIIAMVESAVIQIQESSNELEHYVESIDLDPTRYQEIDQRLTLIYELARKHQVPADLLFEHHQHLCEELDSIEHQDEHLEAMLSNVAALEKTFITHATKLHKQRISKAKILDKKISEKISSLGMPNSKFRTDIVELTAEQAHANGISQIEFLVTANPGQPLQPLNKVASGGELSRISLAIQVTCAQRLLTPIMVFDEVDVGIGGGVAETVGKLLSNLGEKAQILCVTHLPQVAAQGHQHLNVSKKANTELTFTEIVSLTKKQRIAEIARMLGGVKITDSTLAHAKEMLAS